MGNNTSHAMRCLLSHTFNKELDDYAARMNQCLMREMLKEGVSRVQSTSAPFVEVHPADTAGAKRS